MKNTVKFILWTLLAIGIFNGQSIANAEEAGQKKIAYSVQKISPEEEIDSSSSFYDLSVSPGDKREIEARIINSANEPIVVQSALFASYTNANGEISYTSLAEEYDSSLKYRFDQIAEIQASDIKAEIPANSEKIVKATIQVPEDAKDGAILGSWYFEKEGQVDETQNKKGIQINNKYSYALAVKLTVNQEVEKPNLNLNGITKGLSNYKKAYFANLQNDQPAIMSTMDFEAQVLEKGKYDVLHENKSEGLIMAPNSQFLYPVFLGQKAMKAGDYTMKLKVTTKDPKWTNKTWEWSEDFTVTAEEAKKHNEEAINDPESEEDNLWLIIAGVAVFVVLLILLIYLLMKRKMLNMQQEQQRVKKKKRKRK